VTIGVAWIREGGQGDELWVAMDSRLSRGDRRWDTCPKILTLARRDAFLAFSGATDDAYPVLLQAATSIAVRSFAATGNLEFYGLVADLQKVIDGMLTAVVRDPMHRGKKAPPPPFAESGDSIVFAGFSRKGAGFEIRKLGFNPSSGWRFARMPPRETYGGRKRFVTFGDGYARSALTYRLKNRLAEAGKLASDEPFRFEPLEALWSLLREPEYPNGRRPRSCGGAPQVLRVVAGGSATHIAIRWPGDQPGKDYVCGRPLGAQESVDLALMTQQSAAPALRLELHAPGDWPTASLT